MSDGAAPPSLGRRPGLGIVGLLVLFLFLAPPIFLLAPLALLLLFARPRTVREFLWMALAFAGAIEIGTDLGAASLPGQLVIAAGVMMAGAFLIAALILPRSTTLSRASLAVAAGTMGVLLWASWAGVTVDAVDQAVQAELQRAFDIWLKGASVEQTMTAGAVVPGVVRLFPGMVAVQAMAGLALAWRWHHRIAVHPIGASPRPFTDFRFNDHLVWGAIFTLSIAMLPLGQLIGRVAGCGLVVWIGIYATRGLAVVATAGRRWPFPAKLLLAVMSLLALPIAIGTMTSIGLGDTWVDFRSRMARTSGGSHADGSDSS